jgi:hypothetical protein
LAFSELTAAVDKKNAKLDSLRHFILHESKIKGKEKHTKISLKESLLSFKLLNVLAFWSFGCVLFPCVNALWHFYKLGNFTLVICPY